MTSHRTDELLQAIRALPDGERRRLLRQAAVEPGQGASGSGMAPASVIGLFADEPELLAEVSEAAMAARERDPLRHGGG